MTTMMRMNIMIMMKMTMDRHSDFEYDDLYDDVGDDYDYDAWHLNCSCRPFNEVHIPKIEMFDYQRKDLKGLVPLTGP